MMNTCPCVSAANYQGCCSPLHLGVCKATSPEQLMRSRYSAFVKDDIEYIYATHSPSTRHEISIESISQWNQQCQWLGLDIKSTREQDDIGYVEFIAWYKQNNQLMFHHEISRFEKREIDDVFLKRLNTQQDNKAWYFIDATYPENKVKLPLRNDSCVCGSNKKFKKCCGK